MEFKEPSETKHTRESVIGELKGALAEVYKGGSFDVEPDLIKRLIERVEAGDFDDDLLGALRELDKILENRQEPYH